MFFTEAGRIRIVVRTLVACMIAISLPEDVIRPLGRYFRACDQTRLGRTIRLQADQLLNQKNANLSTLYLLRFRNGGFATMRIRMEFLSVNWSFP